MHQAYRDILDAAATKPKWWDENGTPRFAGHHPKLSPNIYVREVVLLLISCQSCDREFRVQMVASRMDNVWQRVSAFGPAGKLADDAIAVAKSLLEFVGAAANDESVRKVEDIVSELETLRTKPAPTLADQIRAGTIHYGDPPRHDHHDDCPAGDTMNCIDLRVIEYWTRKNEARDWCRVAELEIAFPQEAE